MTNEDAAHRLAALDAAIARGIADASAGRVRPAVEVFDELRERIRRKMVTGESGSTPDTP
jgi:predicted transcriptional regulator